MSMMRGSVRIRKMATALLLAAAALVAPLKAHSECDPIKYRKCACPAGCNETYCERQGQFVTAITDPKTGEILWCGYYWLDCMCGALGCAPSPAVPPIVRLVEGIVGAGLAHAAETRSGSPATPSPEKARSEISVENAHGAFSFSEPSEREQGGAGIGVQLVVKGGNLTVAAVVEDGPAERAGMKAGDAVISIDGKAMKGVGLEQAVGAMRGKPGTLVVLRIASKGAKGGVRKIPLIRQFSAFKRRGDESVNIVVKDFPKPETGGKCAEEMGGCLFLTEQQARCYYSCKAGN